MKGQTYIDPRKAARERAAKAESQKRVDEHKPKGYFIPLCDRGLRTVSKKRLEEKLDELRDFEFNMKFHANMCRQLNEIVPGFVIIKSTPQYTIDRERERMLKVLEKLVEEI